MPYPVSTDPQAVRQLQRSLWRFVDGHLLWAFNPQYPAQRTVRPR